ncbi:TIGR02594 family protein [Sandarakinorhabdus rubra]|uniref:TIGR02594 family protein n=1 Tax=Sandarakinorhabdus rubra TaxID=2672568 RepID=UPI001F207FD9|nr:TIGR02594 family protein [Sandarakinorhabdus rubra]
MRPLHFALPGRLPLETKAAPDPLALPWLATARGLLGLAEVAGPAANPLIIGWGRRLKIDYRSDETSWCGLFVAHCLTQALPDEPLPDGLLSARRWQRFGIACPVPQPGAVMLFWRVARSDWRGHVGFYVGEDAAAYHILGGNQGNRVSVARFAKARLLGARWPSTAPAPAGGPRLLRADGRLSVNEQ